MRILIVALAAGMAAGCARASVPGPRDETATSAARVAALDTVQARRLCANADSVIAAGRACMLHEQGARIRILP